MGDHLLHTGSHPRLCFSTSVVLGRKSLSLFLFLSLSLSLSPSGFQRVADLGRKGSGWYECVQRLLMAGKAHSPS